jgi:hypothetical protein
MGVAKMTRAGGRHARARTHKAEKEGRSNRVEKLNGRGLVLYQREDATIRSMACSECVRANRLSEPWGRSKSVGLVGEEGNTMQEKEGGEHRRADQWNGPGHLEESPCSHRRTAPSDPNPGPVRTQLRSTWGGVVSTHLTKSYLLVC